ncbi:MAG: ATP-binding protein [Bacteroidetes bacterium]|nr:ATP-binding protein [Bacteroidota bacterium]
MIAHYSVICRREELKSIRDRLGAELETHGITGLLRDQVVLAVDEACANAIIHGNDCDENRTIRIEAELREGILTVRIYDVGQFEFDPKLLERDIDYFIRNKMKGGLGLKLIHAIMDEVRFDLVDGVCVCTMIKAVPVS